MSKILLFDGFSVLHLDAPPQPHAVLGLLKGDGIMRGATVHCDVRRLALVERGESLGLVYNEPSPSLAPPFSPLFQDAMWY